MNDGIRRKRPIAVIECFQEIPCDPCVFSCPQHAISMDHLTALPKLDEKACVGCGLCVINCPGQAIIMQLKDYDTDYSTVSFPWEYYPLPRAGDIVTATDRQGRPLCEARVLSAKNPERNNGTALVTLLIPKDRHNEVRFMIRPDESTHD